MNKKPIIIIASVLVVALCSFLFIRSKYLAKPEQKEVLAFLDHFNADIKQGFTDTLLNYFDGKQNNKQLVKLLSALSNKTGLNGKDKALFNVNLLSSDSEIRILNAELVEANVPVEFKEDNAGVERTVLTLKLRKISTGQFKITQIDARKFVKDFIAYQTKVNTLNGVEEVTYSTATLAAFKTAESLKTRYDSVIWFAHLENKNYFYVVKGKWNDRDTAVKAQMGLVGPDLKAVIPPQYDMIHNINGTINGLVEVEKGELRGLYDLNGKIIVPVTYEHIYPVNNDAGIAVLKKGDDYFYLGKDLSISNKADIKLSDFFTKITGLGNTYDIRAKALSVVTEYNSRSDHGAIFITPSYLVDLNMMEKQVDFKNPLRKGNYEEVSENYDIVFDKKQTADPENWIEASYYSIKDHFLGGRGDLYQKNNIVIVDKKRNKIYTESLENDFGGGEGDGSYMGSCNMGGIRVINDTLYEVRCGAYLSIDLYDSTKTVNEGTYYHYLSIKGDKMTELPNRRMFSFTKYIKMDDSYINGCYVLGDGKSNTKVTLEMLRYMKNEIYADYLYQFKDPRWQRVFENITSEYDRKLKQTKPLNANVDDSLTVIDKYNINFINNKLKGGKQPQTLAAAK